MREYFPPAVPKLKFLAIVVSRPREGSVGLGSATQINETREIGRGSRCPLGELGSMTSLWGLCHGGTGVGGVGGTIELLPTSR